MTYVIKQFVNSYILVNIDNWTNIYIAKGGNIPNLSLNDILVPRTYNTSDKQQVIQGEAENNDN